jgi:hypothetical protein
MSGFGPDMTDEERTLHVRLGVLRLEHRDLDSAIVALSGGIVQDQLQLARLKKKKLALKDEIRQLENRLIPDIIA